MITRLVDGMWWFDYQGVNAYLVDDGATVTLVDTGMPWQAGRFVDDVRRVAGDVKSVDQVLITHFDFDHVGGLNRLADAGLDAPVYVGTDDEPYLTGRQKPNWRNRKGALQRVAGLTRESPTLPVETVDDGDTVGGFEAYHTPGHTPGHTAFVHEEMGVAAVGDLVKERDGEFAVPPWYLNYDQDGAKRSLRSFVERSPAYDVVCQGHGTPCAERGSERLAAAAGALTV